LNTSSSGFPQFPVLHRAEWIVPVSSPPVSNASVLTAGGRILAAGPFNQLRKDCPAQTRVVDHGRTALIPALVNAHTHIDLSAIKGKIPFPTKGFADWLNTFFTLRGELGNDAIKNGFDRGTQELLDGGTAVFGDVTNGIVMTESLRLPERHIFLELIGFNCGSIISAMPLGIDPTSNGTAFAIVPHSTYSVSPRIIADAKEWTRARRLPFTIHTAEHEEEIEFLRSGTGFCRNLLEKLGKWNPGWVPPQKTPVQYLDTLGVLDESTLLVHAVHMLDSDWTLAAQRKCAVCFCPRSNRNLNAGRPDLTKALSRNILTALGTDSLASNTDLNLFAEAGFVLENYPAIRPDTVLEMITLNPAKVLGRERDFGSIEPGKKEPLLAVSIESDLDASRLAEALIHSGKKGAWKWVNSDQS
jgi:aminodeoxyfutalosine deaminase